MKKKIVRQNTKKFYRKMTRTFETVYGATRFTGIMPDLGFKKGQYIYIWSGRQDEPELYESVYENAWGKNTISPFRLIFNGYNDKGMEARYDSRIWKRILI